MKDSSSGNSLILIEVYTFINTPHSVEAPKINNNDLTSVNSSRLSDYQRFAYASAHPLVKNSLKSLFIRHRF